MQEDDDMESLYQMEDILKAVEMVNRLLAIVMGETKVGNDGGAQTQEEVIALVSKTFFLSACAEKLLGRTVRAFYRSAVYETTGADDGVSVEAVHNIGIVIKMVESHEVGLGIDLGHINAERIAKGTWEDIVHLLELLHFCLSECSSLAPRPITKVLDAEPTVLAKKTTTATKAQSAWERRKEYSKSTYRKETRPESAPPASIRTKPETWVVSTSSQPSRHVNSFTDTVAQRRSIALRRREYSQQLLSKQRSHPKRVRDPQRPVSTPAPLSTFADASSSHPPSTAGTGDAYQPSPAASSSSSIPSFTDVISIEPALAAKLSQVLTLLASDKREGKGGKGDEETGAMVEVAASVRLAESFAKVAAANERAKNEIVDRARRAVEQNRMHRKRVEELKRREFIREMEGRKRSREERQRSLEARLFKEVFVDAVMEGKERLLLERRDAKVEARKKLAKRKTMKEVEEAKYSLYYRAMQEKENERRKEEAKMSRMDDIILHQLDAERRDNLDMERRNFLDKVDQREEYAYAKKMDPKVVQKILKEQVRELTSL